MLEEFRTVPLGEVYESPLNTRRYFDQAALNELTASVREKGVLAPLLVREKENAKKSGGKYEILAGARRYRAATTAACSHVPVRVKEADDAEALEIITIDNLQRENLHPLEEAEGYRELLKLPGRDVPAIAAKIGKSESYVYQRLKLTELIKPAKDAFLADAISLGHAIIIARLQPADQAEALKQSCTQRWDHRIGKDIRVAVSVRELTAYVEREIMLDLHGAPFATDDATLVPKAGACTTCSKRTGFTPALFPDIAKKDTCTDRICFKAKLTAQVTRTKAELTGGGATLVEISTQYGGDAAKGKPLRQHQWNEVKKGAKKCPAVHSAIVVDGHEDFGKVLTVCTNKDCRVHGTRGHTYTPTKAVRERQAKWKAQQERQTRKRELAAEVSRRIFNTLLPKVPKTLRRPELERLAMWAVRDAYYGDDEKLIADVLGIELPKKRHWQASTPLFEAAIRKLDDGVLQRFLAVLPLISEHEGMRPGERGQSMLAAAAKQYGVNVKKIEQAVLDEEKAKVKAAKGKARKGKGAKGKAATPEPACEQCGCTENAACEGGCAWDPGFRKKKRWVCSTPSCVKGAKKAA